MKTENKIIKLFIREKNQMTIREIAKKIKADYRITHIATQRLIQKKIITTKTVGKSTLCSLNESYYGIEVYRAEDDAKKQLQKNKDVNQLCKEILTKVKTSFFVFLIFGSYARGSYTKNSDIDMLFISDEKSFEDKINSILSILPLKTHALVFTQKEFKSMLDSKQLNVVKEAVGSHIIIYGTENFYHLKNA